MKVKLEQYKEQNDENLVRSIEFNKAKRNGNRTVLKAREKEWKWTMEL